MEPKRPADSITQMTEIILPSDSNALGGAFGGRVMQWIDVCGAVAAQRHCRKTVVTASMDELHFRAPIRMGHVACLEARVNAAFSRSLEVEVVVHSENPLTGERRLCCDAFLTFAALDDDFKPTSVPPLLSESEDEIARADEAAKRRAKRLEGRPS
ncbi:MAG: acyl-CoA thioesterase [Deltaproteobacteria bacterium]